MRKSRTRVDASRSLTVRRSLGRSAAIAVTAGCLPHRRAPHTASDMSPSRASDEGREQVAEGLRADLLEGRLTVDEYEKRLGLAYRASTVEELHSLVADLPDW